MSHRRWLLAGLLAGPLLAQAPPRLQAVFPPGGQAGRSVSIKLLGGVAGARELVVFGDGLKGELARRESGADPAARQLYQQKCGTCHELRNPENRQMSPQQWAATVDRMINVRGADIDRPDRDKIVAFLQAEAANSQVTGTITIAPNAQPGVRELRVVTANGVSTAFPFYVSQANESLEAEPNDGFDQAMAVDLPGVVDGVCERTGDVDTIKFEAKAGQRLLLRAVAYKLNQDSQNYFSACLLLYDAEHKLISRNMGLDDLDPAIDFAVSKSGTYYLQCRDLTYRGGAANIYRLELGELGLRPSLYPLGGQRGQPVDAIVVSDNQPQRSWKTVLDKALPLGLTDLESPFGLFKFHVSDLPDAFDPGQDEPLEIDVPCVVNGWIGQPGERDRYLIRIGERDIRALQPWAVVGPFDAAQAGLDQLFPPERELLTGQVQEGASYPGKGGAKSWAVRPPDGNGAYSLANGANEVWYAVHRFDMAQEASGLLSLGTDDGCKVWLNGQLVHLSRAARAAVPADDLVPVRLRRGTNQIVLKIHNVSGPAGFVASAGAWSLEVFARRLGSPLRPSLKLGYGSGWLWQSPAEGPDRPSGDVRCDWSFVRPGEYGIQIEDLNGEGGERYGYRLQVAPAQPTASFRVFPSHPSVPRGGQVPVIVERTSLGGYTGDVAVQFDGLPPGLTATAGVIPPDKSAAVLVLQAERSAQPAFAPVRVVAEVPGPSGPVQFEARPEDYFRIQNNAIPIPRRSMVAAVTSQEAPYTLAVTPASLPVRPGSSANLAVSLTRRPGFGDDVTLVVQGLPPGVSSNSAVLRGGTRNATLQLNFNANLRTTPFGQSLRKDVYRCVVVGLAGGDGLSGGMMYCSNPVVLEPYDPSTAPRPAQPAPGAAPAAPSADEAAGRAVLEKKCTACHALIDPEETRKSFADWTQTVDRMIGKGAALNAAERQQLLSYLRAVTARQAR